MNKIKKVKIALIFGCTGQDGSYLAEFLLRKEYHVYGVYRRSSTNTFERLSGIINDNNFTLIECDITDASGVSKIIYDVEPDEIYNLAAQSHVGTSFANPASTFQINTIGLLNILEAVRREKDHYSKNDTKVYHASTSELFGNNYTISKTYKPPHIENGMRIQLPDVKEYTEKKHQNESTPFNPLSPYAVSKVAAHNLINMYKESYAMFCCAGILFNHESPRRGENFVTRKITKWIAEFVKWDDLNYFLHFNHPHLTSGLDHIKLPRPPYEFDTDNILILYGNGCSFPKLRLGNLDAKRDWGYAGDYVEAMYLMLQRESPTNYVISTGETRSIREFLDVAFACVNIDDWRDLVVVDPEFYRPSEVDYLCGDSRKAKKELGWSPQTGFKELVQTMVKSDIKLSQENHRGL